MPAGIGDAESAPPATGLTSSPGVVVDLVCLATTLPDCLMKGVLKRLEHPVWRALLALLVLVAGYWVGGLIRQSGSDPQFGRVESSVDNRPAMDRLPQDDLKGSARAPLDSDGSVRLSRAQWSKLIRNPQLVNVSLLDCLPEIRPANGGVGEFLGGISTTRIVSGPFTSRPAKPELYGQANVFGWSEEQTERVCRLLLDYGRLLADAEKKGAFIDYPEPGRIRFDFSASRAERNELTERLKSQLIQVLGERDAERFERLSRMEGLAKALPDDYVISAKIVGRSLEIEAPGLPVPGIHVEQDAPINIHASSISFMDRRIHHLGLSIDWSHLDPRSEPAPSSQR